MSNNNNNSNENEINEDNYSEDTHEDTYEEQEEQEEQDEIDIPLIKNPDEIESRKSKHRESSRDRDVPIKKLHSKLPGKSSLKLQESNEKFTGAVTAKDTVKEGTKEGTKECTKEGTKEKPFFLKYRWYILFFGILLCIGLYFLWTKKLKMMFHSGDVSTNSSNQTLELNLLDSMNKNI